MATSLPYDVITADQFLAIRFPPDRKYELVDGVIRMMTGGTPAHARVAGNILRFLYPRLRGTGCRPYGSDMGLRTSDTGIRYPDVSIYCGDPATPEREQARVFTDPVILFEILSPSTATKDAAEKLAEYRALASVDTIVLVDPAAELSRVVQRLGPTAWRDDLFAEAHDIALPALGLAIPHAELFARD